MNLNYSQPQENISEREFIHRDDISEYIRQTIHLELAGTNISGYCATCHTIETRTTKKSHLNHALIEVIKGNTLKGIFLK